MLQLQCGLVHQRALSRNGNGVAEAPHRFPVNPARPIATRDGRFGVRVGWGVCRTFRSSSIFFAESGP